MLIAEGLDYMSFQGPFQPKLFSVTKKPYIGDIWTLSGRWRPRIIGPDKKKKCWSALSTKMELSSNAFHVSSTSLMPCASKRNIKKKSLMASKDSTLEANDWLPDNVQVKKESHSKTHGHLQQSDWDHLRVQDGWNEAQYSACSLGRGDAGCLTSRLPSDPGTDGTNLAERGWWISNPPKFPQTAFAFSATLPSSKRDLLLSKRCRIRHKKWHSCFSLENSTQHLRSSWISQVYYLISLIWMNLLSEQLQICIYHSWLDSLYFTWMKY